MTTAGRCSAKKEHRSNLRSMTYEWQTHRKKKWPDGSQRTWHQCGWRQERKRWREPSWTNTYICGCQSISKKLDAETIFLVLKQWSLECKEVENSVVVVGKIEFVRFDVCCCDQVFVCVEENSLGLRYPRRTRKAKKKDGSEASRVSVETEWKLIRPNLKGTTLLQLYHLTIK